MGSRLLLGVALATAACSSKKTSEDPPPARRSASTADATSGVGSAAAAGPDAPPEGPTDNLYPADLAELVASLGLDGPTAPERIDPTSTARFATITRRRDPARSAYVQAIHAYRIADGTLVLESEAELPLTEHNLISWVWRDAKELVLLYGDGTMRAGVIADNPLHGRDTTDRFCVTRVRPVSVVGLVVRGG